MEDLLLLNAYRLGLIGDCFHVFAVLMLFIKILHSRSVFGISLKSLFLFGLAYTIRCSDIYKSYFSVSAGSVYITVLKGVFLLSIILLIVLTFKESIENIIKKEYDTFPIKNLISLTFLVAFFINYYVERNRSDSIWTFLMKVAWTFSIYVEAVAILPQLFMISKFGNTDAFMILYLIAMATYRGLYITTWASAYKHGYYYDRYTVVGGLIEGLFWILGLILVFSLKVRACEGQEQKKMVIYNVNVKSDVEECTLIMKMNFNKNKNQTQMDQVPPVVQVRNVKPLKVKMENECKNKKHNKKVIASKGQKKSNKK